MEHIQERKREFGWLMVVYEKQPDREIGDGFFFTISYSGKGKINFMRITV
jgi:hypothetical protein